jgi:hypothetical protein
MLFICLCLWLLLLFAVCFYVIRLAKTEAIFTPFEQQVLTTFVRNNPHFVLKTSGGCFENKWGFEGKFWPLVLASFVEMIQN